MAGYWLKLYTEILDDIKYYRLSDNAKLGMYELMLIAKKDGGEGEIPPIDEICFVTHNSRTPEWWQQVIDELQKIEFIVENGSDKKIRKFQERQQRVEGADRQKALREKKQHDEYSRDESLRINSKNVTEKEREKEIKKETEEIEKKDTASTFSQEEKSAFRNAIATLYTTGKVSKVDYETWLLSLDLVGVNNGVYKVRTINSTQRRWLVPRLPAISDILQAQVEVC